MKLLGFFHWFKDLHFLIYSLKTQREKKKREMEKKQETKRQRLILIPCPYQGHINPMLQLATFFFNNGFSITIAHTFFNSLDPSLHPDFEFVRLKDDLSNDDVSSLDLASILLAINVNCRASLEEEIAAAIMREGEGRRGEGYGEVVCIIHDELMYFCEDVANHFQIRSMVFRTTSVATCLSRCFVRQLLVEGRVPVPGSIWQEEIPHLHPLRFKDLPLPMTSDFFKFTEIVIKMYTINTTKAVIWNTMDWLEASELIQTKNKYCRIIPIFPIGPIHKTASASGSLLKEDSHCLAWLDKQPSNSVIYVSLGSIALLTKEEVEEMAWGLANSQQPFLWVIRPGSVRGLDWLDFMQPSGFRDMVGERGCIVEWAPQKEVLAHRAVGGFWSHCGWNSTVESLGEGVPMLCRPYSGDQRVNARYISYVWRVGLELESGLKREEIERRITSLMVEEEGRKMRERAMDFKHKIEASVRKDGSSSRTLKELVDLIRSFQSI